MRASQRALADVVDGLVLAGVRAPDRVYVRAEQRGRVRLLLWGMEHAGLRCEVVESSLPDRPAATWAIERDLRRVGGALGRRGERTFSEPALAVHGGPRGAR